MALKFQNNGWATLASGITSGATSIALTAGQGANFPAFSAGDYMWATLIAALTGNVEVVLVTARATDTLTVLRGLDGTAAQAFAAGDRIEARLSNGSLRSLQQEAASAVAAAGTDTYTATLSPAPQALNTDQIYFVKFANANTIINPTVNFNGFGAKTVVTSAGNALSVGALQSGAITALHYDGTNLRLLNGTASAGNMVVNDFTGDGSTVAFTLTADPGSANNTWICVGGVYQQKNTYTVVGTALTFSSAPGLNISIEVVIGTALAIGTPSDSTVTLAKLAALNTKGDLLSHNGTSHVRKGVGSDGQIVVAASGQSDGLIWTDYTRLPLNINANWLLDQYRLGAALTVNTTGVLGPDGWSADASGGGAFSLQVVTDPDNAQYNALKISCTTAAVSPAAADRYHIFTALEGADVVDLASGTASATKLTVMFKFKSSVTGTYGISIRNAAFNRSYVGSITVPDTAEHPYVVTLTLDTTGTWVYNTGIGMYLTLSLAEGSGAQTVTTGAWQAGNFLSPTTQCNFMSANTNVAYLKRLHVIPSGVALAYASQDYARDIFRAERYWQSWGGTSGTEVVGGSGMTYSATAGLLIIPFKQQMRAAPALLYSALGDWVFSTATIPGVPTSFALSNIGLTSARLDVTCSAASFGFPQPVFMYANSTTAARIHLNSRLS